jgi:hypothetical protein
MMFDKEFCGKSTQIWTILSGARDFFWKTALLQASAARTALEGSTVSDHPIKLLGKLKNLTRLVAFDRSPRKIRIAISTSVQGTFDHFIWIAYLTKCMSLMASLTS